MKNLKNKKGFTLVELLAVIVVLAIVMGLAVVGITSVLENTRKSAFAADAKSFIQGAHNLVSTDEATVLLGGTAEYAPSCAGANGSTDSKTIPLSKIPLQSGSGEKSPYGNPYNKSNSMITVTSTVGAGGVCTYEYKIYLTDDVYSIGTSDSPVTETAVNASQVNIKAA